MTSHSYFNSLVYRHFKLDLRWITDLIRRLLKGFRKIFLLIRFIDFLDCVETRVISAKRNPYISKPNLVKTSLQDAR